MPWQHEADEDLLMWLLKCNMKIWDFFLLLLELNKKLRKVQLVCEQPGKPDAITRDSAE